MDGKAMQEPLSAKELKEGLIELEGKIVEFGEIMDELEEKGCEMFSDMSLEFFAKVMIHKYIMLICRYADVRVKEIDFKPDEGMFRKPKGKQ